MPDLERLAGAVVGRGAGGLDLGAEPVGGRHVGGEQAVPEVAEVLVEGAGGDVGSLADVGGGDVGVAVLAERFRHRREQAQALVLLDQVGGDAVAAGREATGEGGARREGAVLGARGRPVAVRVIATSLRARPRSRSSSSLASSNASSAASLPR